MNKFVIATFSDEAKAYEGVTAFRQLHDEGSITVYQTVVVKREADGKITTRQRTPQEDIGGGLGSLLGALIGAFGGPVGLAVGFVGGGAAGTLAGFTAGDVSEDLLEDVSKEMKPGMFAVLAEVSEPWSAPVDTRIRTLGGKVLRENRRDVVESILEKRSREQREWLDEKKADHQTKKAQRMQADVEQDIADARDKLQRTAEKAKQRLDQTKQEMDEKLKTLQQQAAKAKPEVKKEIDERIARIRQDYAEREKKLSRAWDAAQQALQP
jgi:uncharacterized membrane protein/ElaB/YqjD/DUF883 family membrane-anchored ribosome-binding protein